MLEFGQDCRKARKLGSLDRITLQDRQYNVEVEILYAKMSHGGPGEVAEEPGAGLLGVAHGGLPEAAPEEPEEHKLCVTQIHKWAGSQPASPIPELELKEEDPRATGREP